MKGFSIGRRGAGIVLAGLALGAVALGAIACGDDDAGGSSADKAAVQSTIDQINASTKNGDGATFLTYVTDQGLQQVFFTSRDQVQQDPSSIKDDSPFVPDKITVNGSKATATGKIDDSASSSFDQHADILFVKQDSVWKVDGMTPASSPAPAGAKDVNVTLNEFAFGVNTADIPAGKPIQFHIQNIGEQAHFMDLVKIPADANVQDIIQEAASSDGPPPADIQDIGGTLPFAPGTKADVAFTGSLEPGRYIMVCFMPDKDGTPHALKGMVTDFTVK